MAGTAFMLAPMKRLVPNLPSSAPGRLGLQALVSRFLVSGASEDEVSSGAPGSHEYYTSAAIRNSTISGNSGTGQSAFVDSATIMNSTISNNRRPAQSQVISVSSRSKVARFRTEDGGAGGSGSNASISNSTIAGNTSASNGGDIYIGYDARIAISNHTIIGNTAFLGDGIRVD